MRARTIHIGAMVGCIALALLNGCAPNNDPVAQAEKGERNAPGIAETRAIAEDGFIYGLPLVMAYTASYEFWVDRTSSQYKGPFNELYNERRVFTYKDTAVITPNSDTPYSFACLDLRAEPWVPPSEIAPFSRVTGCCGRRRPRPGYLATTRRKRCIP